MSALPAEDQVLQQTETIWKFLDNLSTKNPKEYKSFIDSVLKDGAENNLGPPVERFVVETVKLPEVIPVRKYFINFVAWSQLPKPDTESSPIAIATSNIRKEVIEKEWAQVIDVALSPFVFELASTTERCVLAELSFRHIESKFSPLKLSRKYKILEDTTKYLGNRDNLLDFMCPSALKTTLNNAVNGVDRNLNLEEIRKTYKKGSEIDLDTSNITNKTKTKTHNTSLVDATNNNMQLKELTTVSYTDDLETRNRSSLSRRPRTEMTIDKDSKRIEVTIYLPNVTGVRECDLDITENSLSLRVPNKYHLDLSLPVVVDIDESSAKFVTDRKVLLIDARILLPP